MPQAPVNTFGQSISQAGGSIVPQTQNGQIAPNLTTAPTPSTTMDADKIGASANTPSFVFPTEAPDAGTSARKANSLNTSIPTAASIINQETAQTPAEQQNQSLLQKLAAAIGSKTSLATLQSNQESQSNVPGLTKTVNDFNSQLEGLNNQATALQNDAGQYGAIQNKERLAESGGNVEAAMHGRPLTKDALLQNQIQQSAIASQSLTLKSAIYAAQGNLSLAKDAADKAAQAQFDAEEQQINYQKALIDANAPQMTKEEKAQADTVKAQLDDRQNQIDNAKEDKKTAIALAASAIKNFPNDPAAQYAAQEAIKESNQQQPDLQKIYSLVGKYQQDPLDVQQKLASIAASRANTANSYSEINARNNPANKPATQAQYTEAGYASRISQANSIINNLTSSISSANPVTFGGAGLVPSFLQSSDRQQYEQAKRNFVNAVLRQESGAAISPTEFDSAEKQYFPVPGDSPATIQQKSANRDLVQKNFINAAGNAYQAPAGAATASTSQTYTTSDGKVYKQGADGLYYPQ